MKIMNSLKQLVARCTIIALCATLLTASCDNKENIEPEDCNVYVAGDVNGAATLWKNGVAHNLTDGTRMAKAHSVFVSGRDVYVVGYEASGQEYIKEGVVSTYTSNRNVAKLWKNGVAQNLTDGTYDAEAYSVFVSGSNVYVAGFEASGQEYQLYGKHNHSVAKLWKNGVAQNFNDGTYSAWAISVFVSGSDVYVAGEDDTGGFAVLWKNGVKQNLADVIFPGTWVSPVFVSGKDVYVAGHETDWTGGNNVVAVLWKNGVKQNLTEITNTSATSVFVLGSDVYVAGTVGKFINAKHVTNAVLWKNGVMQNLTGITFLDTWAHSVFVSGKDVYVLGEEFAPFTGTVVILWKNGVRQNLTDESTFARAYSVFVK